MASLVGEYTLGSACWEIFLNGVSTGTYLSVDVAADGEKIVAGAVAACVKAKPACGEANGEENQGVVEAKTEALAEGDTKDDATAFSELARCSICLSDGET